MTIEGTVKDKHRAWNIKVTTSHLWVLKNLKTCYPDTIWFVSLM